MEEIGDPEREDEAQLDSSAGSLSRDDSEDDSESGSNSEGPMDEPSELRGCSDSKTLTEEIRKSHAKMRKLLRTLQFCIMRKASSPESSLNSDSESESDLLLSDEFGSSSARVDSARRVSDSCPIGTSCAVLKLELVVPISAEKLSATECTSEQVPTASDACINHSKLSALTCSWLKLL